MNFSNYQAKLSLDITDNICAKTNSSTLSFDQVT